MRYLFAALLAGMVYAGLVICMLLISQPDSNPGVHIKITTACIGAAPHEIVSVNGQVIQCMTTPAP